MNFMFILLYLTVIHKSLADRQLSYLCFALISTNLTMCFIFLFCVHRIVKTITSAVGDLNINSADAAAAIHAKCLICDKPVTSTGRARTALSSNGLPKNRSSSMVNSSTMPLLGYSKAMDDSNLNQAQLQHHENTMFNRLTSKDPNVSQQERVKVATELAIMRSSIEPLPDINVSNRAICDTM